MTKAQQKAKARKALKAIEKSYISEIMANYEDFGITLMYFSEGLQTVELTTPEFEENYMVSNGTAISMNHAGYSMNKKAHLAYFTLSDFNRNVKYKVKNKKELVIKTHIMLIEDRAQELAAQMLKRFSTSL
ncbi:hypothetical protein SOX05_08640 [Pseudomonas putida]|nr:hypothetical protein [Pseudomonas putida]MDY4319328.1 hypothetical protein [Pseudomonas putida]MDY4352713.1 hypothetical protein [Pseudomonas putida]